MLETSMPLPLSDSNHSQVARTKRTTWSSRIHDLLADLVPELLGAGITAVLPQIFGPLGSAYIGAAVFVLVHFMH